MSDLPAPYADEAAAWTVAPPGSRVCGARQAEARSARATLDQHILNGKQLVPEEERRLWLIVAAASDTAELSSTAIGRYRTRLANRAFGDAMLLQYHDRDHASSRGPYSVEDPRWTEDAQSRREYVRQEWAARPAEAGQVDP